MFLAVVISRNISKYHNINHICDSNLEQQNSNIPHLTDDCSIQGLADILVISYRLISNIGMAQKVKPWVFAVFDHFSFDPVPSQGLCGGDPQTCRPGMKLQAVTKAKCFKWNLELGDKIDPGGRDQLP